MFRIKDPFMDANTSRTIRFTEELFEELNQVAAENRVSFNKLVLMCCRYALDHREKDENE